MAQKINVDSTPNLFQPTLYFHQGDIGREFQIEVVSKDGYSIPSGSSVKIQATKPSGLGFNVTGTVSGNVVSFSATEGMTDEAGRFPAQIEITSGGTVIYTANFLMVSQDNTHPASTTDGSQEEIVSEITLLVERAESAAATAGADAAAAAQAQVDEMMDYLPTEVSNLKSDFEGGTGLFASKRGTVTYNGSWVNVPVIENLNLEAGVTYTVTCTLNRTAPSTFYVDTRDSTNHSIDGGGGTIATGDTSLTLSFTPSADKPSSKIIVTAGATSNGVVATCGISCTYSSSLKERLTNIENGSIGAYITSATDLNSLTSYKHLALSASALTSNSNAPVVGETAYIEVIPVKGYNMVYQIIYYPLTGRAFFRMRDGDQVWRVWRPFNPKAEYINTATDLNSIVEDGMLSLSGASLTSSSHAPIEGYTAFLVTHTVSGYSMVYQDLYYPTAKRRFFRQRGGNEVWLDWVELATVGGSEIAVRYYSPMLSEIAFKDAVQSRRNGQEIAVYNGHIFDFGEGVVSIDGGANISITNGHGNNANFGKTLHGDYPYLYCASWAKDDGHIYVNQYDNGAFSLVDTIDFPTLEGYLNAVVDEENDRIYILLNTSESTYVGEIDFIVADMSGNILSRHSVDNIPVVEGMTYYNGNIIVSSGHLNDGYANYVTIFDTSGNMLSKSDHVVTSNTLEGIDVDVATGIMYIATELTVYK